MGEAFLRQDLVETSWTVSSAGLLPSGSPVVDEVEDVMSGRYGIDLEDHRSRRLSALLLAEVDLVLAMERRHVREVAMTEPSAFARAFTVKEFLRRAVASPPTGQIADEYFKLLSAGRPAKSMLGHAPEDEVEDPLGRGRVVFEQSADELQGLMKSVASVLRQLP